MVEVMLTTIDNPYDPFTHYKEWFTWDRRMGYNTPGLLARVVRSSNEISETDQQLAIEQAIDEVVRENVLGVLVKVTRSET